MTTGEKLYLLLVIVSFVGFAAVLAYHSRHPGEGASGQHGTGGPHG